MKKSITLLAALAGTTAMAQTVLVLPDITVSANLAETTLDATGASVTVLTGDEINTTQNTNITRTLQQTPSLTVTGNGGFGQTSNVSIRGANQTYVGVFYDGIDVTDPSYVQSFYDFGATYGGTLGRVEVLRGSQGALYGSSAVGGVVNLQSARPTEDGVHGSIDVFGGSFDTFGTASSLLYKNGRSEFALNFEHVQTEGISAADEQGLDDSTDADNNNEADGSTSSRISAYGKVDVTSALTIGANAFYQTSETDYDDIDAFHYLTVDGTPDDVAAVDQFGYRAFAEYSHGDFTHEFYVSGTQTERTYTGTSDQYDFGAGMVVNKAFDNSFESTRQTIGYRGNFNYSDANRITAGVEHSVTSYEASGFTTFGPNTGDGETSLSSFFAEAAFAPVENIDLTADYRYDEHSEFGGFNSFRAAAAVKPIAGVTLRVSYGTGYRAPSLYELFDAQYGNPNLTPEESVSWDIGAEYAFDNGSIKATYFDIEIDNFIQYVSDPVTFAGGYENVEGMSTRKGFELEGSYNVNQALDVSLAYSNITAEDADGEKLIRVPESQLNLGANYRSDLGLNLDVNLTHVAGLEDAYYDAATFGTTQVKLDDYTLLDARIGYEIGSGEIYLAGNNLTDADYQTAYAYGTAGRSFTVGYKFDF